MESGTKLGHYEVSTLLGKGGMGEVWRARDTKLGREVAIKTLPEEFAKDADRLARFEREAKLLASLNHPNIAAIYGLEEHEGTRFLVLELVEGDTLADRLNRGAVPVEASIKLALQIADALKAAHDKGVIHRDLKPLNIKVTDDDNVKVLDFGLAKAFAGDEAEASVSNSPTLSMAATQQGVILGTAAYMSPEQAKGRAVDKRTDIWAFGCVLYEMLTGRQSFGASDVTESLAAVIRSEPQWDTLPANLHPRLREVVERCLEKAVAERFQDIGDVRVDIQKALTDPDGVLVQPAAEVVLTAPTSKLPWVAAIAVAAIIASVAVWNLKTLPPTDPGPVIRFTFDLPEGQRFRNDGQQVVAFSRDGRHVVYNATGGLYLRSMDELAVRLIPGTDEADLATPFFSPNGQWVGYTSDGQLKKIAVSGGTPVTLTETGPQPIYGASWQADNTILYGHPEGILSVSASGGNPEVLLTADVIEVLYGPEMLPDGDTVLYTLMRLDVVGQWDQAAIVAQSVGSGERKILFRGGSDARYLPTGHLTYAVGNDLFAVPFDLGRLEVTGGPVPLIQGVMRSTTAQTGTANYGLSDRGALVYVAGRDNVSSSDRILALVDRNGNVNAIDLPPGPYIHPRLSPDGSQLAIGTEEDGEIWVYDLNSLGALRQLTFGGGNRFPIWTPDGEYITFQSNRDGDLAIFRQRADGSSGAERLTRNIGDGEGHEPESWSPDGGTLSFDRWLSTEQGVWAMSMESDGPPTIFVDTIGLVEKHSSFSPDGRLLAYMSATVTPEVFVQPFPPTGAIYKVSDGRTPLWSPNGAGLFFHDVPTNRLMVVEVQTEPGFRFGVPEPLPIAGTLHPILQRNYDVTPDGSQLLVVLPASLPPDGTATPLGQIAIVQNWFEELKERVPVP